MLGVKRRAKRIQFFSSKKIRCFMCFLPFWFSKRHEVPGVGPRMPLSVAAPKASNASSLPPWVWWVARAVAIRLRRIPAISGPTCP